MVDRLDQIAALLKSAGWLNCQRTPLAGDLSTRHYSRLFKGSNTAIMMDADSTMQPFVFMTDWLRQAGLSVPEVIAGKPEVGLLLLEDFGDVSVNRYLLENPGQAEELHRGIVDLLLTIRASKTPDLDAPNAKTLVEWTEFTDRHYPGTDSKGLEDFRKVLAANLTDALAEKATVSLRDFHADNLMWLTDRNGVHRFGLLDYQDAFLTHPAYDLVSFLTDARVSVSAARREQTLQMYLRQSKDEENKFRKAFAAFSAQRNLRILGIFAHGAANGRGHHLNKLPRVHGYFVDALRHPIFDDIRDKTLTALPDPMSVISELSA